jgi:peptidoglycan/xylan/chitin deacetylase (PgdA/CDA1 family)
VQQADKKSAAKVLNNCCCINTLAFIDLQEFRSTSMALSRQYLATSAGGANMLSKPLSKLCIIGVVLLSLAAIGQSTDRTVVVNIMIDAEISPSSQNLTLEEEASLELSSLVEMLKDIDSKGINTTVYFTGDFASRQIGNISYRDYLLGVASKPNHEIAMHSMSTADKLGLMSYEQQLSLLSRSKAIIEAAYIRDNKSLTVLGFRPQYFNQSIDTYNVLDEMGMAYDSGYKAGLLYLPGHENDTWPYLVENHTFYAVPVSTYSVAGKLLYACDLCSKQVVGLNGTQWSDLLVKKFQECADRGDPLVVLFHNFVSGEDSEYMTAFRSFVDFAASENATFVTTMDLVEIAKRNRPMNGISPVATGLNSTILSADRATA